MDRDHRPDAESRRHGRWRSFIAPYLGIQSAARRYLLGSFFTGMGWAVFMLLLNLYLRELGYPESFIGRLWSMFSVGMILMTIPAATMIARFSVRWLVVLSTLLAAGCYLVLVMVNVPLLMMVACAGTGMMSAISRVASAPFFMRHTTPVERSHVFSLQFAAMLGAGLFAYFGGGWLHRALTGALDSSVAAYRTLLIGGACSTMVAALVYLGIPSGTIVDRSQTAASLIQRARSKGPLLFKLTFPFFIIGLGAGLVIPFLNLYFRDRFGMEPLAIGFYYGLVQSSMLLGVLAGPYLARRWGMIRMVVYTELASLPFMVLLAFSHNLHLAVGAFVLRGALMNMGIPIANNYLMERVGQSDRAVANGLSMLAWTLSWALATWVGGALIEHIGYTEPLLAAGGLYLIAAILYYWFFRHEEIYAGEQSATPVGRVANT
ncbi:MFS transporter [Candidatus Zixiibacteriota bacterium]